MKYELIICRKSLKSDFNLLDNLVKSLKAKKITDVSCGFNSKNEFSVVYDDIQKLIGRFFNIVLIGIDGTENEPIPNLIKTNDKTIEYYLDALQDKGAGVRYAIRIGSELHYSNEEHRLRTREDKAQSQAGRN
jgi:hypothetical protein